MSNMYDHANNLAKSLKDSEEFGQLKEAYEQVMGNEDSKNLFGRFRETQLNLQEKQMEGVEITEEEVQTANKVVEEVQQDESISNLLDTEQHLNTTINELSQIITKPLEELYQETE